jgi:hypothetical protein
MPAPKGNTYASKPDNEILAFTQSIRANFAERKAWRDRAKADGISTNLWCRNALNAALKRKRRPC